jgi:hypothetical protein
LLFEYVDLRSSIGTLRRICRRGGTLGVVLQLPSNEHSLISPSPYASLSALGSVMKLVAPSDLCSQAVAAGFTPGQSKVISAVSGKPFWLQAFRSCCDSTAPDHAIRGASLAKRQ